MAFCEDELLNLYNKLTSKNVVFIKDGHQVTPTNTEDVSQLISQINEQRKERFWDCIALLNYLYKTNKELYNAFDEYVNFLKIAYPGETARTDDLNEYSYTEEPQSPLDYWIEFE